jgi:hypothetical protein
LKSSLSRGGIGWGIWKQVSRKVPPLGGSQRQEGNGRSDAERLLTRETLWRVRNAPRGRRERIQVLALEPAPGDDPKETRVNPMTGSRMQQACSRQSGANRRGGEKPRGRNMAGGWHRRLPGMRFGVSAQASVWDRASAWQEWTLSRWNGGGAQANELQERGSLGSASAGLRGAPAIEQVSEEEVKVEGRH